MIGRMVAVRPWFFAQWHNPELKITVAEVWNRYCGYLADDFAPKQALTQLKGFTPYFARNFVFGHTLFTAVQGATTWPAALDRANQFLSSSPALSQTLSLSGL